MSSRVVYAVAAILTLTAAYACWCRAPLIWDGAYQFDWTLEQQSPYIYLTRFHTFFLWWPTVWASHLTNNAMILQAVFGLPFLLAPVAALLISWWLVKDHLPHLIIWVIFGVAIATLPGQIFVINDSIFQQHLFWPIFVGLFVPMTWPKRLVLGLLAIFQFVHPIGVPLLFGAALAAGAIAMVDHSRRRSLLTRAAIMLALCLLAFAKFQISQHIPRLHDYYAEKQATWENALIQWRTGVVPMLVGLRWMWAAGAAAFAEPFIRRRAPRLGIVARLAALACAGFGAVQWCGIARGADTGEQVYWTGAIDYRRWIAPLAFPFFFFLAAEVFLQARRKLPGTLSFTADRCLLAVLLAAVFALYLGMQCTTWAHDTSRLLLEVRTYPSVVVPLLDKELEWTWSTPLTHWATGNCIAAMQGKQPAKVFLDPPTERKLRGEPLPDEREAGDLPTGKLEPRSPYYPIPITQPPGPSGWFDFRPMLLQLSKEPPSTRPRRAENVP